MYQPRLLAEALREARRQLPVVLITGPRQSGKSTLVRHELGQVPYVTFDDPLEAEFARDDPAGFLDRFDGPVILDEIQLVPGLMPHIKLRVDADRRPGRFVLTGSQQFSMMAPVSESLAGRVAILELLPLSLAERPEPVSLEALTWNGAYPEPALHPERRDLWVRGYVRTYVERDVRQMRQIADLAAFEQLIMLAAATHGQELNIARLSRQVGMSQPTVKSWMGVLEAAYLGVRVPPYFRNLGKRVVKSPKWFLLDSALVCELTRQPSAEAALAGAMGGALFEGLVVVEALKAMTHAGLRPELYHWRSHDQLEVDLIVRTREGLLPIEIKKTATPKVAHVKPLTKFLELESEAAGHGLLVCRVETERVLPGGHRALPWHALPEWLGGRLVRAARSRRTTSKRTSAPSVPPHRRDPSAAGHAGLRRADQRRALSVALAPGGGPSGDEVGDAGRDRGGPWSGRTGRGHGGGPVGFLAGLRVGVAPRARGVGLRRTLLLRGRRGIGFFLRRRLEGVVQEAGRLLTPRGVEVGLALGRKLVAARVQVPLGARGGGDDHHPAEHHELRAPRCVHGLLALFLPPWGEN